MVEAGQVAGVEALRVLDGGPLLLSLALARDASRGNRVLELNTGP